jgi:putative Mg2+ transporter-C (MgtC) family protein
MMPATSEGEAMALMDLGTSNVMETAAKMALSYVFALPAGWQGEREGGVLGIRTFPIVSVASCAYMLIAVQGAGGTGDLRALQGLMTGIGFVGGGAILREGGAVHGTATAASVWAMGAVGAAIAFGRLDVAFVLAILSFLTLRALLPLKRRLDRRDTPRDPPDDARR